MIDISHVTFSYGKNTVLNDVNLTINPQSLTAFIGLNGAGKSTLFGCLSKQNQISNGHIMVSGKEISSYSFKEYSKIVSVVPQLSSIKQVDYKVRDFMVEGRTPYLSAFAVPSIKEYRFSEKIAIKMGVEKYLDKDFAKLSGGQQQLVLLARALVQDTPIILLDEPMSALDLRNQSFLLKIIKQLSAEGKAVLFSTHNPNHALLLGCDVVMLRNGTVICHDTAERCLTKENLYDVFGDSVQLAECDYGSIAALVI